MVDHRTKAGTMSHSKCVACKTRLFRAPGPPDHVGDLCPGCGELLEPVGSLAEVVGFRSIRPREEPIDEDAPDVGPRLADHVYDLLGHREARLMQARIDADAQDERPLGAAAVAQACSEAMWDGPIR